MPTLEFTRVSRWMYVAEGYVIRWGMVGNAWTVKEPGGGTLGEVRVLDEAKALAIRHKPMVDDGVHGLEDRYLTDGHEGAKLVEEADDDEEQSTMKTCECLILTGDVDDGALIAKPCTERVPDRREFKPGHDAKLKSTLLKAFRADDRIVIVDGGSRTETTASKMAADRSWSKFMTPAPPRKPRKAKADGKDNSGVDHADDQPDAVFAGDRGELDPTTLEPVGMSQLARIKIRNGTWKDGVVTKVEGGANASDPQFYTVVYQNAKKKKVEVRLPADSDRLELG